MATIDTFHYDNRDFEIINSIPGASNILLCIKTTEEEGVDEETSTLFEKDKLYIGNSINCDLSVFRVVNIINKDIPITIKFVPRKVDEIINFYNTNKGSKDYKNW